MRSTTKLLAVGFGATGLLLTACEVPGGPPPVAPAVVFENPSLDSTPVPSLPAFLKGTLVTEEQSEVEAEGLFTSEDHFHVTVPEGGQWVQVHCPVGDDQLGVSFVDAGVDIYPCGPGQPIEGPFFLAEGDHDITVYSTSPDAGVTSYSVKIDVVEGNQD